MVWQYNPYFFSLALVAALAFALAVYLFCRRPGPGSIPLACFMIAMGIWALAYGMEIGSQTVPMVKLAAKLQYFGISPGPLLWFFFALDFTGRHRWLKFPLVALLLLVPLVTLVMVWTSDLHPFMINNVILDTRYEFSRMTWRPGFWMWIDSLYGYSLMFSGTVLCLVALRRVSSLFRVQALLISVGLLLPMVTSLIYILQIGSTLKSLNVVPFAFTTAGALLTLGLSRWNLLDIVPVARSVLVEKMRDPVVVLDVRQRIVDLNPAALQLIGRSFEDVLGCQIGEVIPFLPPITEPYLNHAQVCSEVALGTEEVPRTFDVRITPLRNRQDRLRGHLLVLHDISALQAALQQARAADLAKSQFVNNVSHELRTPLTSIKLYLDLLSIGSEARRGEYFQSIHRETARLQTLIEDLLMISRLDLGKLNMSPVTVSVNQLVQMLVQDRREVFAQHELALVLDVSPGMPTITADPKLIERVLTNLMTNALQYTPPGGQVTLETFPLEVEGVPGVAIAVRDTGVGIPTEELPQVFARFHRGTSSKEHDVSGAGLGLAICKQIVGLHGGRITVESIVDAGATFTVWLPLAVPGTATSGVVSVS